MKCKLIKLKAMKQEQNKRQSKIDAGKVWRVYPNNDLDNILFEGSETACRRFINANCKVQYKYGSVRLGKVIYELLETKEINKI